MNDETKRRHGESPEYAVALQRLTALARDELPPPQAPGSAPAAYARFRRAKFSVSKSVGDRGSPLRRLISAPVLGAAMTLALLVGGVAAWRLTVSRPLTVVAMGGAIDEGGFVRPATAEVARLHFSDGTEVDLPSSSRARVAATTAHGARVMLEHGRARARVVPRRSSQWLFDAGPCRIEVTGTRFDMQWSAPAQVLEVTLYSGSVTVKGPPAEAGVPMHAGQHLVMDVRRGSVRLSELPVSALAHPRGGSGEAAAAIVPALPTLPALPTEPPLGPEPAAAEPPPTTNRHRNESWPASVLLGEFRAVISQARRRGIERVLREDSAENIMALADASRYVGRFPLAQKALLRVRTRFPHTAAADRAAFLLGRVAEDQNGNLGKALTWYDTYLADARDDAFRAEALGRKMAATLKLSGRERARSVATQYLGSFPHGPYAPAARSILAP